jgi:hypothetical protein
MVIARWILRGAEMSRCVGLVLFLTSWASVTASAAGDKPATKALIEFGWDEPDTAFLRRHLRTMEETPFDGCVFHANFKDRAGKVGSFTWSCWGKRAFAEEELKEALVDLEGLKPERFTQNFLRFNTSPADLDWFDDFSAIVSNARLAGRLAKAGKCAGVLLDTEQYEKPLFRYRKQRDAASRSWDEYAARCQRRGLEVMEAFQAEFPEITILLTFGHSLPWRDAFQKSDKPTPLADGEYGLLAPFLDGMIDAAKKPARIVDGYELSYGFKDLARFKDAYVTIKDKSRAVSANPAAYANTVTAGFGLWLDYDWRKHGWDVEHPEKNYFTPESFEASVRKAIETSDQYVWIYSETPRWWTEQGGTVKLPDAYVQALRNARRALTAE